MGMGIGTFLASRDEASFNIMNPMFKVGWGGGGRRNRSLSGQGDSGWAGASPLKWHPAFWIGRGCVAACNHHNSSFPLQTPLSSPPPLPSLSSGYGPPSCGWLGCHPLLGQQPRSLAAALPQPVALVHGAEALPRRGPRPHQEAFVRTAQVSRFVETD